MNSTLAAAPPRIRVLIADDHALVREGIRKVLAFGAGIELVGEWGNVFVPEELKSVGRVQAVDVA